MALLKRDRNNPEIFHGEFISYKRDQEGSWKEFINNQWFDSNNVATKRNESFYLEHFANPAVNVPCETLINSGLF